MKKTVRVAALVLAAVMVVMTLAACGTTLSGVYTSEASLGSLIGGKGSYNFKGSNVTLTITATFLGQQSTTEYEGKYEIAKADDGTQTIAFTFESEDAKSYSGSYSFAQDKDAGTITIGGTVYTKAK